MGRIHSALKCSGACRRRITSSRSVGYLERCRITWALTTTKENVEKVRGQVFAGIAEEKAHLGTTNCSALANEQLSDFGYRSGIWLPDTWPWVSQGKRKTGLSVRLKSESCWEHSLRIGWFVQDSYAPGRERFVVVVVCFFFGYFCGLKQ